jgi:acetoin utilization deacetylase AcuC-like enzyme
MAGKVCKWYEVCPMKRFYEQGKLENEWIEEYCNGDYQRCVRYWLKEENFMTTGVFFSEKFIGKSWPIVGDRYRNFKTILSDISARRNVKLFTPEPISEDMLRRVHTKEMLERERKAWYYDGARITVGGCVQASEKVWKGEIDNAVVFMAAAGHHAGKSRAWGGTYLSCIGPIAIRLRELGVKRLVYFDTDCHHGDGAREILRDDEEALHICFCSSDKKEGSKICINVGWRMSDEEYLAKVEEGLKIAEDFKPEIIVHFFGHDTHRNDYGSRGLSEHFFIELAKRMKEFSVKMCNGRYILIDGGGANREVTEYIFPRIIEILRR